MRDLPVVLEVSEPGLLSVGDQTFRCALGPAGIVVDKHEGDGGTPTGKFPIRRVFYRPDRLTAPETRLPVSALSNRDGWCDDPDSPDYNRHVLLPCATSHERLWRDDRIYDVIVEVGYNDDPPIPGRGSAIFMHVARDDYSPTQGCVALRLEDLLHALSVCDPGAVLNVNSPR